MSRPVIQKGLKNMSYIDTLYRMLDQNFPMDKIASWISDNGPKYTIPLIKRTFKKANREELISEFIEEEDIKVGDHVRSRQTGRDGNVIGIKSDGDTIIVAWTTGGSQLLSKEAVFKITKKTFSKVHTTSEPYADVK